MNFKNYYLLLICFFLSFGTMSAQGVSSFTLTSGDTSLTALAEPYAYSASFGPTDTMTHLTAVFSTGTLSYSVNGTNSNLDSATPSGDIILPIGESHLIVIYTPISGDPITYNIYLIRPIPITGVVVEGSTDPNILDFEAGDYSAVLTPVFNMNTHQYEITVPHNVVKARVVFTIDDTGAQNITSTNKWIGWLNGSLQESPGNTFTSQWGNINVGSTSWGPAIDTNTTHGQASSGYYMTNITRESAFTENSVSSLTLTSGDTSLTALAEPYAYSASFGPTDTMTHLTAVFSTGTLSYSVNGTNSNLNSATPSGDIILPIGESHLIVIYTPISGDPITYNIYLIRPIPITGVIVEGSTDPNILDFEAGDYSAVLTPEFNMNTHQYEITVPHNVVKARVVFTIDDTGAQNITSTNKWIGWLNGSLQESPGNTFTSQWGNINVGNTAWGPAIDTNTTHGQASSGYYMTNITRESAFTENSVSSLTLTSGDTSLTALADPYAYSASFGPTDTMTHLIAVFSTGTLSYSVNGTNSNLNSATPSGDIILPIGESHLIVIYTPISGDPITYNIYLIRPIPITGVVVEGSTDPNILDFEAGDYSAVLTPEFNMNTHQYEITVPHNVVKARVVFTIDDTGAQNITSTNKWIGWLNGSLQESPGNTFTSQWGNINVGSTSWGPIIDTNTTHGQASSGYYMTNITRSASLGIEDLTLTDIYLYPNPTSNVLNIGGNKSESLVIIYDLLGQEVMKAHTVDQINVSALNIGTYLVCIFNDNGRSTHRFVKN